MAARGEGNTMLRIFGQALLGIACLAPLISAQTGYAVVTGQVKDASGGVIPGATISARAAAPGAVP